MKKSQLINKILGLLLLSVLSLSEPAHAIGFGDSLGLSPHWDWKTIETKHFRVTFPSELTETAKKTSLYLEQTHEVLSKALFWEPKTKTQILVIDNTDSANGLTAAALRFGIVLMVTPPDNWFPTAYYDDWLKLLVIHEYAHMLNLDVSSSFWSVIRLFFGDIITPNSFWPRWMLEGLAVYMETRYTTEGRGRSTYFNMILRTQVEKNRLKTGEFATLDRVTNINPYFPEGETPYLFGYFLWNTLVQDPANQTRHNTHDKETLVGKSEDLIGLMSTRSGGRVPFFLNGNTENLTGKDWYKYWDEWVASMQSQSEKQLEVIRSKPVTAIKKITQNADDILGSAISPNGKWIAYTMDTLDERTGIYLQNLQSGESHRLADKIQGSSITFTPDSKSLMYSSIRRRGGYTSFSELAMIDLHSGSFHWLSKDLRARDPNISLDGKRVVFTLTQGESTHLGIADLKKEDDEYQLSKPGILYKVDKFARVSNPQFSPDGKSVLFSLKKNEGKGEDIAVYSFEDKQVKILVQDGFYNRFPTYSPKGEVYYISDRTGVDNLYRYQSPDSLMLTNVTTGLRFPTVSNRGVFASVMTPHGWDLAEIKTDTTNAYSPDALKIQKFAGPSEGTIPPEKTADQSSPASTETPVEDYSIFPSIWPRAWSPVLLYDPGSLYMGGQILGFDATDRHQYALFGAYDSFVKTGDWFAYYSNRMFGPTLGLVGSTFTTGVESANGSVTRYVREHDYSVTLSQPFYWSWSNFTPIAFLNLERNFYYAPKISGDPVLKSRYVPNLGLLTVFSNAYKTTDLRISAQAARRVMIGAGVYMDSGNNTWKGLISDSEFFKLFGYSTGTAKFSAAHVSRASSFADANVVVSGEKNKTFYLDLDLPTQSLEKLHIRGYPQRTFYVKTAAVTSLDLDFPFLEIFRGPGTLPIFVRNLSFFTFGELTFFPSTRLGDLTLPSTGGGLKLGTNVFYEVPLTVSVEYHYGLKKDLGGDGEAFLTVYTSPLSF